MRSWPLETTIRPRGPYSLALSARRASDTTRRFGNGVLTCVLAGGERASAGQLPDGRLVLRTETEAGLDQLRFVLGAEDDHTPFLERFRDDELLAGPIRHLKGLRPIRTATVTHALMRAIVSQLITSREARSIEWKLIHATTESVGDLQAPPLPHHSAGLLPPSSTASGSRLARRPLSSASAEPSTPSGCDGFRPTRPRPGSSASAASARTRSGSSGREGLGRFDRGIVGDLGLLKVCSAIEGRWVEPEDTARILGRYEEWAGLACVYLMAGAGRGLVPLKLTRPEVRRERVKARYARLNSAHGYEWTPDRDPRRGKIGESLLSGLLSAGWRKPEEIVVTGRRQERIDELAERYGVEATLSNADAVSGASFIVSPSSRRTSRCCSARSAGCSRPSRPCFRSRPRCRLRRSRST